ncbi:hypothetical protein TNCV_840801 [Trichonephila clavipes]|nr:hypothetical protein TNCV_840801 [Trichonephila clavipes]
MVHKGIRSGHGCKLVTDSASVETWVRKTSPVVTFGEINGSILMRAEVNDFLGVSNGLSFHSTLLGWVKSVCGDDEEESNDEEYNRKHASSTEIDPNNLPERAIIVLDKMTTSYLMARKCNR